MTTCFHYRSVVKNLFVVAVVSLWFPFGGRTAFADGLVPVGSQPHGGLSGKIVYTHGGHGITAANQADGAWTFQRGPSHGMIEDLGNVDQMAFLVDYSFRAGATIVPLRPVGHQPNEVVIDNDDPNVTFTGKWSDATDAKVYFGKPGHVPCRRTATSRVETAHARYTPNIRVAGFYPVYAWTSSGGDRATDQLYRVHHSGGTTEVTINHRRVGNGLVYLGTYYFDAGRKGYVDISNRSKCPHSVVVADMIRFGNGMGDISRGMAGISHWERSDESGLYWVMWHANRATGVSESDYRATNKDRDAAVSFSPRYAAYMNREADGRLADRVFVSFHSNASGPGSHGRGTLGLYNGNNRRSAETPHQLVLAQSLASEVNDELVAQNGTFEHDWSNRKNDVTLDRKDIEFGEINNEYIHDEFDATIVEVAFHDNQQDAELLRDPKVRDAIARATYHGLIKYFRAVDNEQTPAIASPPPVTGAHVESNTAGSVTISWLPPKAGRYEGGTPTGYRIYASTNGYGFDGGTLVKGAQKNTATLSGYDPQKIYYFKVAAVNPGGESPPSEVVAALPSGGAKQVLIVNGFHRLDRTLDPTQTYDGKTVDRVWPRQSNSRDYVVQVATAIAAAAPGTHVASTSNEAVSSGAVNLNEYKTAVWILGTESTHDHTFDAVEQKNVEQFIAGGGNLFVTGSEIGWDLDAQDNGRAFYQKTLKGKFVADRAKSSQVSGAPGSIFDGLEFSFDNGSKFYDVNSPDVIAAEPVAHVALQYANGGGAAAVQFGGTAGRGSIVMFGFPFETITTSGDRATVMRRVLDFFHE
ncbi:MAG TPA: fibronectin type III domain-containing protein [Lacipirellulaceae bacterium]|nr:fibronectin type III domain-containing protein [Lacipirellulaceae bacterium]